MFPPPKERKLTLIVQEAFGAREVPQLLVWVSSLGLSEPDIDIPEMVRAALPVLVRVTESRSFLPSPGSTKSIVVEDNSATGNIPWILMEMDVGVTTPASTTCLPPFNETTSIMPSRLKSPVIYSPVKFGRTVKKTGGLNVPSPFPS